MRSKPGILKKTAKKNHANFSFLISHFSIRKGFSLIELLIIFAISSVIVGISVSSFGTYNNSQTHRAGVLEVVSTLNATRSRAISQVKPAGCGSNPLDGYEIRVTLSGQDYEQYAICGATPTLIDKKKLSSKLSFSNGSASVTRFDVSSGTVASPGSIVILGLGKTTTISVNKIGIVAITDGQSVTPSVSIPTVTPPVGDSTAVTLTTLPNPSSLYQSVAFTVTVTGTACTPSGYALFYADGSQSPLTGVVLSGNNPKNGTTSYPALSMGTHSIQAKYFTTSSCPAANSQAITHRVQ